MSHVFKHLLPVEEAQKIIFSHIKKIDKIEVVNLDSALWRVSVETIYSPIDIPTFDRATRDGYAVRAEDIYEASEKTPVRLFLRGYIKTGTYPEVSVGAGEAVRVDTGAPIPLGANCVVPIEYTSEENDQVVVYRRVPINANIQGAGGDIMKGEPIIQRGTLITPRHIGVLAGVGIKEIMVKRKPKLAVFSIGDELISIGEKLEKGKIYDINIHSLQALIREKYSEPILLGVAKDSVDSILQKIEEGVKHADMIISTGGSSVGQSDFIRSAIETLGAKILFHGVMSKPGKPVLAAIINNKIYLGLPGNPTSAIISFMLYVEPAIRKMLGIKLYKPNTRKIKLLQREYSVKGRRLYKTIILKPSGTYEDIPPSSESISTLLKADAFFVVPETVEFLEDGTEVEIDYFESEYQPAELLIVGEYSPRIIREIIHIAEDKYNIKYIRKNDTAALLSLENGVADIAITKREITGAKKIEREIVLIGKEKPRTIASTKKIDQNTVVVPTYQSAIHRVLNGDIEGAVIPREIAELYGVSIIDRVDKEYLYIYSTKHQDIIKKLNINIV